MSDAATPGERVSHYRVIERIGFGGMGEVYRARDERLGRQVALKFLPSHLTGRSEARARFEREARTASALDHPHICTIHEIDRTDDDRSFIVMAYYEGETLERRLEAGPMPVSEAVEVAKQLASGLHRAHAQGIVHRDLKPANIVLTVDGTAKILDFGIAKLVGGETLTATGDSVGTPAHMAPEQIEGGPVDARSDLWALGTVLYQMLTGRHPFERPTPRERIAAILSADPPPPGTLREGIGPDLDDLVLGMLAGEPAGRPGSADIVARRLARLGDGRPGLGQRGTRRLTAAAGLVVGSVLLVMAVQALRSPAEAPIDSVAVLPFENGSPTPEGRYLSDGITASLIDGLSRIGELRVVPLGLAAAFPSAGVDLREAGRSLGVRALVTGQVREIDGTLVVRAELIDVARLSQLWGAQYDRSMTDILEVQDSLVREISEELRLELTSDEARSLLRHRTENSEAYRLYLLSRYHTLSMSPEGVERGREYAEEALRLDPGYALAWTVLADSYLTRVFLGLEPPEEGYANARRAAERAIQLDDSLSAGHMILGFVKHHGEWDWEGALDEFELAHRLDPDNADALQGLSEAHLTLGRVEEAVRFAEMAVDRDPITPIVSTWLAHCYSMARRHDDALEELERALELAPDNLVAAAGLPSALLGVGKTEEAVANLEEGLRSSGLDPDTDPGMALLLARAGRTEDALAILTNPGFEGLSSGVLAAAWGWVGQPDRAFAVLTEAIDRRRGSSLWWIKPSPLFDPLRDDPRFAGILRRMGLPE